LQDDTITYLVKKAMKEDDTAFTELVAVYRSAVYRVTYQILGNAEDAEDAMQETWVTVSQRLSMLKDPSCFGSWLYRVAANTAIRKRQQRSTYHGAIQEFAQAVAPGETPLTEGMTAKYRASIPVAMETLSNKDRLTITLHYFGNMGIVQVADLLGIPVGTVKSRLHHARQKMRKELESMKSTFKRPEHIPADFRKAITGNEGAISWQQLFTDSFSGWSLVKPGVGYQPIDPDNPPEHWQIVGNGVVGEYAEGGVCIAKGDLTWRDYELSVLVTPLSGGNVQICFRMGENAERWYMFDMLLGWQAIAVSEFQYHREPRLIKLSVVNYPLEHEREYSVCIAARERSITTYIDGALVNQVTDSSYQAGGVGLSVWQSKTLFRDIRVRMMN
jgi:RNA polymerase sigma-70 factor (ECF subfamily)